MTSKNSFLANMRENLKRRRGIIVVFSVLLLLVYPVVTALLITSGAGQKEHMSLSLWTQMMTGDITTYLGVNLLTAIIAALMAVIIAVQGFAYLFRREKIDLYMSVPVAKNRRFCVIYLDGLLIYAVPLFFSLLISMCIAAGNGLVTGEMVKSVVFSFLAALVIYLAVYSTAIVAIMLTGNLLVALCATAVFLFYELAIKGLWSALCATFFRTYVLDGAGFDNYVTSPMISFMIKINVDGLENQQVAYLVENIGMSILKLLLGAVVFGVIAYLLYSIRPAESCNKAIAFPKTKPVIKVLLMVPVALVAGLVFYAATSRNISMMIFGIILGAILSHGVMEVIFEFDIKAIAKHLISAGVGAAVAFAVLGIFSFDIFGYDKWVPKADKVESIGIYIPVMNNSGAYEITEQEYIRWISRDKYCMENVKFTNTESFCSLIEEAVNESADEGTDDLIYMKMAYNMKNGKVKYRQVSIDYRAHMEELNEIVKSEEYIEGSNQFYNEKLSSYMELTSIHYSDGVNGDILPEEIINEVLESYKEDLYSLDLNTRVEKLPVAVLTFDYKEKTDRSNFSTISYEFAVYDNFKNTVEKLKEAGNYTEDWREKAGNITAIEIELYDEKGHQLVNERYEDAESIAQITPALVPAELARHNFGTDYYGSYAYVTFSGGDPESDAGYIAGEYTSSFRLESSKIPDFLKVMLSETE